MKQRFLLTLICAVIFLAVAIAFVNLVPAKNMGVVEAASGKVTQGALQVMGRDGLPRAECPLKHTDVKAEVSGQLARVTVTQDFDNPFREKIEAVLHLPAPAVGGRRRHDDGRRRPHGQRPDQAPRRGPGDLRSRARSRTNRQPARPGAPEHLHSIGGEYPAGRAGEDRHQLRRDSEVRRRYVRMSFSRWSSARVTSRAGRAG